MSSYLSKFDPGQVLKKAFNETTEKLKVELDGFSIAIDHTSDSIRIGDGINLVGTTSVGSDVGLNAVIIGGVISASGLSTGIKTSKLIVTDVPSKVTPTPLVNRNSISVRIVGTEAVYFGENASISSNTAYPKYTMEEISIDIKDASSVELYAVCAPGKTSEIRIIEVA